MKKKIELINNIFSAGSLLTPEETPENSHADPGPGMEKFFPLARSKANEIYADLDEIYRTCRQFTEYKKNYAALIKKCFTDEGNGILYSVQQLGGCCSEGNLYRGEEDRCEMIRYFAGNILVQVGKINESRLEKQDAEGLITPEKKGTSKTVLMNYLNAIHEGVHLLKEELLSNQDAASRFHERLWNNTGMHLADLKELLSAGDDNLCEEMKRWYGRMCLLLHRCSIEIIFYGDASDEERKKWFVVKEEIQNIPAVIRTKSEIDEYIYFYGSWFEAEE